MHASVTDVFQKNEFDPIHYFGSSKSDKNKTRLSKNSLRGRSYYILPMKVTFKHASKPTTDKPYDSSKTFLYKEDSHVNDTITDGLLSAQFSDSLKGSYIDWTTKATGPKSLNRSYLSPDNANVEATFLNTIAQKTKSDKTIEKLKRKALNKDTPIVVYHEKFKNESLYYFHFINLPIGLIQGVKLSQINELKF